MKKLHFGTAGIPHSTHPRDTANGIRRIKELGLDSMELEFVRSVNIKKEKAPLIKKVAQRENVVLTCHAPYFVNLNAQDPKKLAASKMRIIHSAQILALCGGYSVCYHPGYYMKMPPKEVFTNMKKSMQDIQDKLKDEGIDIWVRPEIGGKLTSWGSLEELINVCQEVEGVLPCIDWAHLYARSLGKNNSYQEFSDILEALEKGLGKDALQEMHCHVEGVEWTEKGEKNHVNFDNCDFRYKELIKAFKDFRVKGVITCESPNLEKDALAMKKEYEKLK